jgi:hypothetical protein
MGVDTAGRRCDWIEPLLQAETKIKTAILSTKIQDTKREQGYETNICQLSAWSPYQQAGKS